MASKSKSVTSGKAYTPPKGHATVHKTGDDTSRRFSARTEWLIAVAVIVIVIAAIWYFGSDFRTGGTGGGGHSGTGLPTLVSPLSGA